jgi:hypothetical protein
MFLASVEGKMLHGMFNCIFTERENWKEVALKMIKSIKLNTEDSE